jgi:hypothetical protein
LRSGKLPGVQLNSKWQVLPSDLEAFIVSNGKIREAPLDRLKRLEWLDSIKNA